MKSRILHELKEHSPFTATATVLAFILVIIIGQFTTYHKIEHIFESFHMLHVLFSAIATTVVFHKYKQSSGLAILIGTLGSIIIGTLSDIVFPALGTSILGLPTHFHLPIIEIPVTIILIAIIGSLIGLTLKNTHLPHLFHVLFSVFASLFYILSFSSISTPIHYILSVLIVFFAVLIPCCLSDIVFPIAVTHKHHHQK